MQTADTRNQKVCPFMSNNRIQPCLNEKCMAWEPIWLAGCAEKRFDTAACNGFPDAGKCDVCKMGIKPHCKLIISDVF